VRRIQIHLDDALDEAAATEAARRGVSKAALIRDCLRRAGIGMGQPADGADPWDALAGWLDDEPVDDIDAVLYGPEK
jgi:hypothetical protein